MEGTAGRARELRQTQTEAEQRLWQRLRGRQFMRLKFRRQAPFGMYIVDFVSREAKLIIEVDGAQHAEQRAYDAERTRYLEEGGYRVLRFWNNEVLNSFDGVLEAIREAVLLRGGE